MTVSLLSPDPALGSAGTLKSHAADLGDEPCVMVTATRPVRLDVAALLRAHAESAALLTVAARLMAAGEEAADVLIAGDDGRLMGVQPGVHPDEALSDLVDAGIYVVSPEALHHVDAPSAEVGTDLLPALLAWDAPVQVHRLDS